MEENSNNILTEVRGNVGIITLNRPEVLNAVSLEMLNDISYQVQTWDYDENIRVMILQGNDKAFAAGIDVKELSFEISQQSFALKTWQEEFSKIANCSKPLVAAVSGYALGLGCDLALACDIILAAESARFAYPETSIGVIPAFGGCTRLVHTIGRAQTMEIMLTGKALTAEEAAVGGLISRVVPLSDLKEEAIRVAMRIAEQPFQAVMQAKETIKQVENMSPLNGSDLESKSCRLTINTQEFRDLLAKFMQKNG